jgi:tRNA(adenine34) deaminase
MRAIDIARRIWDLWLAPRVADASAGMRVPAIGSSAASAKDREMMARCIELSRTAVGKGELPFASIIYKDGSVITEATNRVSQDNDVTRHAEMVAISTAQQVLGRKRLTGCTFYSNVEPCAMCSLALRETGVSKVVFSIKSPVMGGYSKWNVLGDDTLSTVMAGYFRKPPVVVAGLLMQEAEAVWRDWNPLIWTVIRKRGLFGGHFHPSGDDDAADIQALELPGPNIKPTTSLSTREVGDEDWA